MKKVLGIVLIFVFVYSIIMTVLYIRVNNNYKESNEKLNIFEHTEAPLVSYTFYAKIKNVDIDNNTILVQGLDFDTVYDKEYVLNISNETQLIGNGHTDGSNLLLLSNFKNNQYIAVTYVGAKKYSGDYDIIETVMKVQLLEDINK